MEAQRTCDVLVVGSGIAGCSAAIEAARRGARVVVASLGATFSGSSFYGGTWGLGLVGPSGEADVEDFEQTIRIVGGGVANPTLVHELVLGVAPAVRWLEEIGVELKYPTDASERAYIPCFDHKTRSWHGVGRASLKDTWSREFAQLGIAVLPRCELVDLVVRDGCICGAQLFSHEAGAAVSVACPAVVLATGGLAGLYARSLNPTDNAGSAQGIALAHGCQLVNAEFLQIMPGLVRPKAGIVVNEKAFRYSTLAFPADLLEERSGYGPFTTRLASHVIDLAIAQAGDAGLPLGYALPHDPPEFVQTYFSWLERAQGIRATDPMRMALYAHASNGGIAIREDTSCKGGPAGLFACGECAGGMHGADRIGGLASASALVFGRRAGIEAARLAGGASPTHWDGPVPCVSTTSGAKPLDEKLRHTMSAHALVGRTEEGLAAALDAVAAMRNYLQEGESLRGSVQGLRLAHQLRAAETMLGAMRARRESLGSHHRADSGA